MKRFISALLCVFLIQFNVFSQNRVQEQAYPSNELSFAYGYVTYPEIALTLGGALGTALTGGLSRLGEASMLGSFSLDYQHFVHRSISVGGTLAYEHCILRFDSRAGSSESGEAIYNEGERNHIGVISLMPSAKFQWFNTPHFGMYSKLAAGLMLVCSKDEVSPNFAFQATPAGIDFGGRTFRGFLETGFGCQGLLLAGVRFCF